MDRHRPQPRVFGALCGQIPQTPKDRGPDFTVTLSRVMPPPWAKSLEKLALSPLTRSHGLLADTPRLPVAAGRETQLPVSRVPQTPAILLTATVPKPVLCLTSLQTPQHQPPKTARTGTGELPPPSPTNRDRAGRDAAAEGEENTALLLFH